MKDPLQVPVRSVTAYPLQGDVAFRVRVHVWNRATDRHDVLLLNKLPQSRTQNPECRALSCAKPR